MTEKASADDFQVQDFLKKRKKKKKRKYKEYDKEHENDERESVQDAELCSASPPLLEDQAAQSGEGFKKKKRKRKQEKQQSLLGNSCVELESDISNETGVDASQKKKKKKKWKHNDNMDEKSNAVTCIAVNRSCSDICQEIDADYVYLKLPVQKKRKQKLPEGAEACEVPECVKKKKRKEKLPEEAEVCEVPESVKKKERKEKLPEEAEVCEVPECIYLEPPVKKKERKEKLPEEDAVCEMPESIYLEPPVKKKKKRKQKLPKEAEVCELPECIYLEPSVKKKERKEKLSEEDEVHELPISETHDKSGSKRSKNKRKTSSSTLDIHEEAGVAVDQSLLSPAEQNRQGKGTELPLATEADGVALSQQWHEDGDCDASPAGREDFMDVPANLSKLTKAANQPPKKPPMCSKKIKSRAFITEESSSDSDVTTPELLASNRREDQNNSCTRTVTTDDGNLDDDDDDEEYLNSTMCLFMDLDTAKQELEEFIPHVRNIADTSVMKMAGRDLTRFKEFKKQGIAVKFGRFSQKENNQLRKNIEEFLEMTGIDSAEKVLFTSRYPEEKKNINRLKAEYLFCEKLSEGIPRPWRLIYYRARKIFDPNNYKGRYTKEEKEKLKKYHALHGNDWKKISEMMSRSNLSVAMKYSEIKSATNYGPWSKEEIQKLKRAVEEVIRKRMEMENGNSGREILIDREKLYQKLPWSEIETKVGTRYWRQCKQKWVTILTNKLNKGQHLCRGTKGLQAKINLIKRLHELNVEDPNEVNWEELSDIIGDVPKAYVQAKFYKLKASYVPLWRRKTFSEIIDYLYEKKLPELEEKLEKEKEKNLIPDNSAPRPRKKAFRLSDIFDSSEESD
uniref:Transcription termination factor 1 n=1 Tax=Amazona collaria TaxID=241587 RepID=A0A8B9IRL7_9PSIT